MNQMAPATEAAETLPAKAARNTLTTLSSDGGGIVFHTVAEARDIAYLMAGSDKAVRKHLRNNPGACFGIVIQAVEWGLSPYAVANKSYEVNDQLAYESQLIQAVILRRAPLKGRIKFDYQGEGDQRVCIASAITLDGETVEYRSPPLSKITPKNSPLWKNDPDQQLSYFAGRSLCRRHFPDVLMGIYDVDEIEGSAMRDVTPQPSGLAGRLNGGTGGFSASHVAEALQDAQDGAEGSAETTAPTAVETPASEKPVDWNDATEAAAALDAGKLPDGFSVNASGALVIPDEVHGKKGPRGHSIIAARFDEIVTASGKVVKTKTPAEDDAVFPGDLPNGDGS